MKTGDTVKLVLKSGEEFIGAFIPSHEVGVVILKLKDGYNIAFSKSNVKSMRVVHGYKPRGVSQRCSFKQNPKLPKVAILHTGGTIASKVDYETGGVKALFSAGELLGMFPELYNIARIESIQIMNVLSENLEFEHYNKIANEIKALVKSSAGVIVTHGTDTMHYTASALSFALENLAIPVVLVGSQRSSDRGSTDSALNIINAAHFITKGDYAGVGICMHATTNDEDCFVLKPHNTRKMHSSRRDAFRPINTLPLAIVNYKQGKLKMLSQDYPKKSKASLKLKGFNPKLKLGLLKFRPGLNPEELLAYKGYDGLVIEGSGFGHINLEKPGIKDAIRQLTKKIPVVMTTQCIYSRVNLKIYSTGRELLKLGVIPNEYGLTPETAYIKLAWLLSNYPKQKIRGLFNQDFRGENITRITEQAFLY